MQVSKQTFSVQKQKRDANSCGKIVKNTNRLKTESSIGVSTQASSSSFIEDNHTLNKSMNIKLTQNFIDLRPKSSLKYTLRSQNSIQKYEGKLAIYQKNKRQVLKDLGRITLNVPFNPRESLCAKKNQHFLTAKMKKSLKISLVKNEIEKESQFLTNKAFLSRTLHQERRGSIIQNRLQSQQNCIRSENFSCQRKVFIWAADQLIKAESKLRSLKSQISSKNRKQVRRVLEQVYKQPQQKASKLIKVSYQEFEYPSGKQFLSDAVSAETLAEKLTETHHQTENIWNQMLHKKFNSGFIREFYQHINYEGKIQMDLKTFTREFNIYFDRNYQPKELFRLYERISPLTRGNFLYIFSK